MQAVDVVIVDDIHEPHLKSALPPSVSARWAIFDAALPVVAEVWVIALLAGPDQSWSQSQAE